MRPDAIYFFVWGYMLGACIILSLLCLMLCGTVDKDMAAKTSETIMDIPDISMDIKLNGSNVLLVDANVTENNRIENIVLDIAEPGGGYRPGPSGTHIEIKNAARVIKLLEIERGGDIYSIKVYYSPDESEWLNDTIIGVGEYDNLTFSTSGGEKSGWVYVEIPNASYIYIKAKVNSTVPFKDFSNSIVIWVRDNTSCESAIRKYYDPPETETEVSGLYPYTNKTDYPPDIDSDYARIVEVNDTYYIVGDYVAFIVSLNGSRIDFVSKNLSFGFGHGPLYAFFAIDAGYWDFLVDSVGVLDILVDGEYLCEMRFFDYHVGRGWFSLELVLFAVLVVWLFVVYVWLPRRRRGRQG